MSESFWTDAVTSHAVLLGWDEYDLHGERHYRLVGDQFQEVPVPDIARAHDIAARILEQAEDELDLVKQQQMVNLANAWVDLANSMIEASKV